MLLLPGFTGCVTVKWCHFLTVLLVLTFAFSHLVIYPHSDSHPYNLASIFRYLMKYLWKMLLRRHPNIKLYIMYVISPSLISNVHAKLSESLQGLHFQCLYSKCFVPQKCLQGRECNWCQIRGITERKIIFTCRFALMHRLCQHQSPISDRSGEASAPRSTVQRAFRRSLSEVVCSPSLYPQTLQCEILTERLSHINLGNSRSPVSQLSQGVDKVCCQSVSSLSHMLSVSPLSGCCYGSVSIWNCWRVTNTEARWRRSSTGSH